MTESVRINKYLSTHGYCSRREADRLIEQGKVFINNSTARLGDLVDSSDDIRVLGRDKKQQPRNIYLLLNKPEGTVVTTNRRIRDNVMDLIDSPERVFPVGLLETQSCGLLLFTNDGTLGNRLLNPRYPYETEYVVVVDQSISKLDLGHLQNGIELRDGKTPPAKVRLLSPNRFAIILEEERPKQIKRMCEALGYQIINLMRTRIGPVKMVSSYPQGHWRHLTEKEVRDLKKLVGIETTKKSFKSKK
ncbi:rRNA pseudouridine synthase [Candidatus Uhrbacteria bacterium]|nr:rRNA pseudouridine synthase [Candidatus Uhrbacteria bacterium]